MNTEITARKGKKGHPAAIFIHGLGMNSSMWENPYESRILGGSLPLTSIASVKPLKRDLGIHAGKPRRGFPLLTTGTRPARLKTLWHDLMTGGYTVISWSQKRPMGPMDIAVEELKHVIESDNVIDHREIILIGHSRGGLIARKYLMSGDVKIKGLITIGTPHHGSSVAGLASYVKPFIRFAAPFFRSSGEQTPFRKIMARVSDFLESRASEELRPGSDFFRPLESRVNVPDFCVTVGGTSPSLFTLYRWKIEAQCRSSLTHWYQSPEKVFAFPDVLESIVPGGFYPDEVKIGLGDGLVTDKSSRMDGCPNHFSFHLNHVNLLFDRTARNAVLGCIDDYFGF